MEICELNSYRKNWNSSGKFLSGYCDILAVVFSDQKLSRGNIMLRIAILDDEEVFRTQIRCLIKEILPIESLMIHDFSNANVLDRKRTVSEYDLYLLDIEMPGEDGITIAKGIRETNHQSEIVFVTSHREFALEGYKAHPLDYLLKPIDREELESVLREVLKKKSGPRRSLEIIENHQKIVLLIDEIVSIERESRKSVLHTLDGDLFESTESLKSIVNRIGDANLFIKINRSTYVQVSHVSRIVPQIDPTFKIIVRLRDGRDLEASEEGVKHLRKAFTAYY